MLEKMGDFFDARLEGYEEHQLTCIESAEIFYPLTAAQLPKKPGACVLDLGCGTGLELDFYFKENPDAAVTGIDLAPGMLTRLREKFPHHDLTLRLGSYFELPFGEACCDAAVAVETLHHFTKEEKIPLYKKLHRALKPEGYFILTDYFAASDGEETALRQAYLDKIREEGLSPDVSYHFDTPLTREHETEALLQAGFSRVEILGSWGATCILKAFP